MNRGPDREEWCRQQTINSGYWAMGKKINNERIFMIYKSDWSVKNVDMELMESWSVNRHVIVLDSS